MGKGMAKRRDVDDDDEEDEDDEEENPNHKRMRMFVDDEAEEDDEEDEEEDDEGDLNDLIDDEEAEAEAAQDDYDVRQRSQQRREQRNLLVESAEDLREYAERRFTSQGAAEDGSDDELQLSGIEQQSLQPTHQDPKLFAVKCLNNHEREGVIRLLQKYSNLLKKGIKLGITSAVAPNHVKGKIYVEAYRAEAVKEAIQGLNVLTDKEMQLVPMQEMTECLHVPKPKEKTKVGDWVRVTRGLYNNDLAQVFDIHDGRGDGMVTLRLIPRINYTSTKSFNEDGLKNRPAPKLFDRDEAERLSNTRVEEKTNNYTGERSEVWRDEKFSYGMLYKKISARHLSTDIGQEAEERMRKGLEELSGDPPTVPLDLSQITRQRKVSYFPGDAVIFIRGDLKGLRGKVVSVDGENVSVKCKEIPEPVFCDRRDLSKSFKAGDNVKITSGRQAGESGVVVDVQGELLVLYNDVTRKEIKVIAANVVSETDVSAAPETQSLYQLFDLVSLHTDARGVVVKVSREGLTLLGTDGKTQVKPLQEIKRKITDRQYKLTDKSGTPLSVGDSIRVVEGPHSGRYGVVKHTADNSIFFQAPDESSNCGLLAVPARCVVAQGNKKRGPSFNMNPFSSGNGFGMGGRGGRGGGRGGGAGFGRSRDPILRKEVRVIKGSYKGYAGRAVGASNDTVQVELEGTCKNITVARTNVVPKDGEALPQRSGFDGSRTPAYGSRAPPRDTLGSRTPLHGFGSRTPMHDGFGSRTPMRDAFGSRTPMHDSGSRTPLRDRFGARTPLHESGSRTPMHSSFGGSMHAGAEARTPLHESWGPTTPAHTPGGYDDADKWTGAGPTTPGVDDFQYRDARTPMTPGVDPGTPAFDPRTPVTPMEPATPYDMQGGSPAEDDDDGIGEAKAIVGVEVEHNGKLAYVKEMVGDSNTYVVQYIEESGKAEAQFDALIPVQPEKNDKVCLLRGETSLVGATGELIGVEREENDVEGIVRFENIKDNIRVLKLKNLGKVYKQDDD